jgi:hypothetical protein
MLGAQALVTDVTVDVLKQLDHLAVLSTRRGPASSHRKDEMKKARGSGPGLEKVWVDPS